MNDGAQMGLSHLHHRVPKGVHDVDGQRIRVHGTVLQKHTNVYYFIYEYASHLTADHRAHQNKHDSSRCNFRQAWKSGRRSSVSYQMIIVFQ